MSITSNRWHFTEWKNGVYKILDPPRCHNWRIKLDTIPNIKSQGRKIIGSSKSSEFYSYFYFVRKPIHGQASTDRAINFFNCSASEDHKRDGDVRPVPRFRSLAPVRSWLFRESVIRHYWQSRSFDWFGANNSAITWTESSSRINFKIQNPRISKWNYKSDIFIR